MSEEFLHYFTTTLPFRGTACQSEDGSGSITSELGAASQALWASVTEGCRIGESGEKLYPIASSMPLESVRAFLIAHNHDVEQMTRRTKQAPLTDYIICLSLASTTIQGHPVCRITAKQRQKGLAPPRSSTSKQSSPNKKPNSPRIKLLGKVQRSSGA